MSGEAAHLARRARSFGGVAEVYDRARPGYPDKLFGHIAGQLPGPDVLEVGAGTGKATAGLLAQGLQVTCLEPDAEMAAVLAARTTDAAEPRIEVETLESFVAGDDVFDGLVSAQAWHWTAAGTRMDRAAALLRPGGYLGLFWNRGTYREPEAHAGVQALYDEFGLFGLDRPKEPVGTAAEVASAHDPAGWPGDELAAHPAFEHLGVRVFPWVRHYTATEFTELLLTTSHYRLLEPQLCERLLAAVGALIRERFGDRLTIDWSTGCHQARRRDKRNPGFSLHH